MMNWSAKALRYFYRITLAAPGGLIRSHSVEVTVWFFGLRQFFYDLRKLLLCESFESGCPCVPLRAHG